MILCYSETSVLRASAGDSPALAQQLRVRALASGCPAVSLGCATYELCYLGPGTQPVRLKNKGGTDGICLIVFIALIK